MRASPLLLCGLLAACPLQAQQQSSGDTFGGNCASGSAAGEDLCLRTVEAAGVLGPRLGIALSGGNPVPGTASTLGMRLGSQPRMTIAGRVTASSAKLPGLGSGESGSEQRITPVALALDVGVGLFGGFTLAPTIGGFGSLDLLGGVAHLRVPRDDGFFGTLTSWNAGARVGLLRESFTAPGVSVSASYRRIGAFGYGDPALADHDAWFRVEDMSAWSLRAAASKRLLGLGLTAGAGRDRYAATAVGRVRDGGSSTGTLILQEGDLESTRTTFFANGSFTIIILHAVAEVGWQGGGKEDVALPTTGALERAGMYGSLALRLSL